MSYEDLLGLANIQSLSTRTHNPAFIKIVYSDVGHPISPLFIDMLSTVTTVIILVYQPFAHNFCF